MKYVPGLNSKDRKSTRDKANISNLKVNRGCAPLTANRTSADCVQISLGPSIPYILLGVYHTGRFNAMTSPRPPLCCIWQFAYTLKYNMCLYIVHLCLLLWYMFMAPCVSCIDITVWINFGERKLYLNSFCGERITKYLLIRCNNKYLKILTESFWCRPLIDWIIYLFFFIGREDLIWHSLYLSG